jgi:hypothetical protein
MDTAGKSIICSVIYLSNYKKHKIARFYKLGSYRQESGLLEMAVRPAKKREHHVL